MAQVQIPNEKDFLQMDIDLSLFKEDKRIGDIVFGWYKGVYMAIKL